MPVTRTLLRGWEPDEFGNRAYGVTGTPAADTYTTRGGDAQVFMLGGDDVVTVDSVYTSGIGQIRVETGLGNDVIRDANFSSGESYLGGGGNDRIELSTGDDTSIARGGPGNDVLRSLGGNDDVLFGDEGNDTLRGHESSIDVMNGGPGKDKFFLSGGNDTLVFYANHTGTGINRDLATGFIAGGENVDVINLHGMDADKRPGHDGNQDFIFDGEVPGGGTPVAPGHVAWFHEGGNIGVAWNNGEPDATNGREALLLLDMPGRSLSESDFYL